MKTTNLLLLSTCFAFFSLNSLAYNNDRNVSVFAKYEMNNADSITSAGFAVPFFKRHSDFGAYFTSALGVAEINDKKGVENDFLTWDTGVKFGYFSDVSIYGEVGFDLFEVMFKDRREYDEFDEGYQEYEHVHDTDNEIDGYIGLGVGVDLKPIKIEFFSRIRQIDSDSWESKEHLYSGFQFAIAF